MNKHILHGLVCGGVFAAAITWIAASDAMTEGGLALLASAVFGLAAGLCIGGLSQLISRCSQSKKRKPEKLLRTEPKKP
jgi:hypothetical protein